MFQADKEKIYIFARSPQKSVEFAAERGIIFEKRGI